MSSEAGKSSVFVQLLYKIDFLERRINLPLNIHFYIPSGNSLCCRLEYIWSCQSSHWVFDLYFFCLAAKELCKGLSVCYSITSNSFLFALFIYLIFFNSLLTLHTLCFFMIIFLMHKASRLLM